MYLRKIGGGRYARWNPGTTVQFKAKNFLRWRRYDPTRYGSAMPPTSHSPLPYEPTALPVGMLIIPTKLNGPYPFHISNPVLGNRKTAVKLVFDIGDSGLEMFRLKTIPNSHWDVQDQNLFLNQQDQQVLVRGICKLARKTHRSRTISCLQPLCWLFLLEFGAPDINHACLH